MSDIMEHLRSTAAEPTLLDRLMLFQAPIEKALAYANHRHRFQDVVQRVLNRDAFLYVNGESFVIVEVNHYPAGPELHVWLAAGDLDEIEALTIPAARDFANAVGQQTVKLTLTGRPGFARALQKYDWEQTHVLMQQTITFT